MAGPRQFPDTLEDQLRVLESDEELQEYKSPGGRRWRLTRRARSIISRPRST